MTRLASVPILLALWGCADDPAPTPAIVDPPGVPVVTSTAPRWTAGSGWQVDTTPVTVLGADESDPQQQWVWVEAAVRLSNGNVMLATMGALRLFSAEGKFLRTVSQSGDGPGEMRMVQLLTVLPGDTVRASDHMGLRVATYTGDGTLVRDERIDMERYQQLARWGECDSGVFPDGSRFGCITDSTIPWSATNRPNRLVSEGHTSPGPGLLRQLRRTMVATPDLSAVHPLGIDGSLESFGVSIPGGDMFVIHPFHSRSVIVAGGNPMRVAMARNPEYRIEIWTPTGTLERIIRREGARRAPNQAELDFARTGMLPYLKGADPATMEKVLAAVPTPDSLPAVAGLAITPAGELVVQREGAMIGQASSSWDVFDPEGHWLGSFRLPIHSRLLSIGTDHLVVRRGGESDDRLIEVYRIRRR